jgi:hypothetical protein
MAHDSAAGEGAQIINPLRPAASVTIDGREHAWQFSIEDLRSSIEKQKAEAQESALRSMNNDVRRKKVTQPGG